MTLSRISDTQGSWFDLKNWSEYSLVTNNGTDRGSVYKNTMSEYIDSTGAKINTRWTCPGGPMCMRDYNAAWNRDPKSCNPNMTMKASCVTRPMIEFDPLTQSYVPLVMDILPEGTSSWTAIANYDNYVGMFLFAPISSKFVPSAPQIGKKVGFTGLGLDLRSVTVFLQSIEILQGSLLYITVARNNPILPSPAIGTMVGATRGNSSVAINRTRDGNTVNTTDLFPINCTESLDDVTKVSCNHVLDSPGQFLGFDPMQTYRPKLLDQVFILKVKILSDVQTGLMWALIMIVPNRIIMGPIDDATEETTEHLLKEAEATRQIKQRNYTIMYVALVVAVAVLVLLAIAFTVAITEPMIVLQGEMASVACMELEDVDLKRPPSTLEEIGSMQISFVQMVKNLVEYRNYMPASILARTDDDEEEAIAESVAKSSASGSTRSAASKVKDTASSHKSKASAASRSSMASTRMAAKKTAAASMDIKQKRISILVINVKHWLKQSHDLGQTNSANVHGLYIKKVMETVSSAASKGTPDVFLGDRFLATWNTIRPVATHRTNACRAALASMAAAKAGLMTDDGKTSELELACAISSGEVGCGNMGCDGMKKFTFIGPAATVVHTLERLTRRYKTNLLVDGAVEEEAQNNFVVRKLGQIMVTRVQHRPVRLFEIVSAKAVGEDEWMYQLEEGEKGNPFMTYSAAVDLYLKGTYEEAKATLEKCPIKDHHYDRLMANIEAGTASGKPPETEDVEPKYE